MIPTEDNVEAVVIIMDKVIHQKDSDFRSVLQKMRQGTMDDVVAVDFLLERFWGNLPVEEGGWFWQKCRFLMLTWARTKPIIMKQIPFGDSESNCHVHC